jgi:hypothetical protein
VRLRSSLPHSVHINHRHFSLRSLAILHTRLCSTVSDNSYTSYADRPSRVSPLHTNRMSCVVSDDGDNSAQGHVFDCYTHFLREFFQHRTCRSFLHSLRVTSCDRVMFASQSRDSLTAREFPDRMSAHIRRTLQSHSEIPQTCACANRREGPLVFSLFWTMSASPSFYVSLWSEALL